MRGGAADSRRAAARASPLSAAAGRLRRANGAYAQAPGTPPVELGPVRQPPPKRKAHAEPDDPYAPLGIHAGAFTCSRRSS